LELVKNNEEETEVYDKFTDNFVCMLGDFLDYKD
jgi:hypothetical protein